MSTLGCSPNFIPAFEPIDEQTVYVGEATSITLRATGQGGDPLVYSFEARREGFGRLVDLQRRNERDRPQLQSTKTDGSEAVFVWRPLATDSGAWILKFFVSQGGGPSREQEVRVNVLPSREGIKATFLEPVNEGGSFRADMMPCLELPVRVLIPAVPDGVRLGFRPADTANTTIRQAKVPREPGLFEATFIFCPSPEQLQTQNIFTFHFTATVITDASTLVKRGQVLASKRYLIQPIHPAVRPAGGT